MQTDIIFLIRVPFNGQNPLCSPLSVRKPPAPM